jgi:hypothetical protein
MRAKRFVQTEDWGYRSLGMISNLELFQFSLDNPEPIIDDYYLKSGSLVISGDLRNPTDLMKKNLELLENISAYDTGRKKRDESSCAKAAGKILEIIKSKNMNYSEFVSFWPVVDVSYSQFRKLDEENQETIIKKIVEKYIELRHGLYAACGYSATTLQAAKDAKAHKESGMLGVKKVCAILNRFGYSDADGGSSEDFVTQGDDKYITADKKGKKLFNALLGNYSIKFSWSAEKEEKMPDLMVRHGNHLFIVEHKHMKETGGGQDKQINEIISLIGFLENDPNIHYVSFLDGRYFNLFANDDVGKSKISNQLNNIKRNLTDNPSNYFVNTAGFIKLIESLSG